MWFTGVEVEQETSAAPPKKNPGSAPESVPYNMVPLHGGSFSYISILIGQRKSFVIPQTLLYRGLLYQGSTAQ